MSVKEVLAELKSARLAGTSSLPSWGSGKVVVVQDSQFVDVTHLDIGLTLAEQQAFAQKIDDILLGRADHQEKLYTSRVHQARCKL